MILVELILYLPVDFGVRASCRPAPTETQIAPADRCNHHRASRVKLSGVLHVHATATTAASARARADSRSSCGGAPANPPSAGESMTGCPVRGSPRSAPPGRWASRRSRPYRGGMAATRRRELRAHREPLLAANADACRACSAGLPVAWIARHRAVACKAQRRDPRHAQHSLERGPRHPSGMHASMATWPSRKRSRFARAPAACRC